MMDNPHIKILILNYNGQNIIHKCLESAMGVDYANYSVDVIDNGSTDNSVNIIKESFNNIKIHKIDENLGYSKGYNYGFSKLEKKTFEYYLILNNDAIINENLLKNLLNNANRYGYNNIYGPKIYYSNTSKLWFAGGLYNKFLGIASHIGINEVEDNVLYKANQTNYISGCCMFISKQNIDELKGFDDSYNMYYEDVDLCYRASNNNIKCYVVEGEPIYHEVSYTIGNHSINKKYRMIMSQIKFIYKSNNILFFIISIIINILLIPILLIRKIIKL
tara:strand:- start:28951 stop:29778 length:828 start_codon:yes stop_codon:yes gene_type:complete